jgi:hypothetical protein
MNATYTPQAPERQVAPSLPPRQAVDGLILAAPLHDEQLMQRVLDGLHRLDSPVLCDDRCPS